MSNDKVAILCLQIEWNRGDHHTRNAANDKRDNEAQYIIKRNFQIQLSVPKRGETRENLNSTRDADHHAVDREQTHARRWKTRGEHVMDPQPEADHTNRYQRSNQQGISNDGAARESREDLTHHSQRGNK